MLAAEAEGGSGDVFNVGCGESTSVNEVVAYLRNAIGVAGNVGYGPARPGDVPKSLADISRARQKLGYEPGVLIEEGLKRVTVWFSKAGK